MNIDRLLNFSYYQPQYNSNTILALENYLYSNSTRARFCYSPLLTCPDCKDKIYFDSKKCSCDFIRHIACTKCDIEYPIAFYVTKIVANAKYLKTLGKCKCCRTKAIINTRKTYSQKKEKKIIIYQVKSGVPFTEIELNSIRNYIYDSIVQCKFCDVLVTKYAPKCNCLIREYMKCSCCKQLMSRMFFYGMGTRNGKKQIACPTFIFRMQCIFCYSSLRREKYLPLCRDKPLPRDLDREKN